MFSKKNEPYILWGAVALFYFYQYIIRILPNIIINDLVAEFHLNAKQFATLGAFYLYVYSFLQIPVGILADRIGVKKIALVSIAICILSSYMFVHTNNFYILQLSRMLQGLGSASSFLCALKIVTDSFPTEKVGLFAGITAALGCFGAVFAGQPFAKLIANYGVETSVYIASILGWISFTAILLLILFNKKDNTVEKKQIDMSLLKTNLKYGFTNKMVWMFGIISVGTYTPISVFADFWATGFFTTKYGITTEHAAYGITIMYIGMFVGTIVLPGLFSKKIRESLIILPAIIIALFSIVLYSDTLPNISVLLPIIGFLCGIEILCFTGGMLYSNASNSGIIIGILNTLNAIGAAFGQQIVGGLMDLKWNGTVDQFGVRVYSPDDYSFALSSLSILIIIGILLTIKYVKNKTAK